MTVVARFNWSVRLLWLAAALPASVLCGRAGATRYDIATLNTSPFTGGEAYGIYEGQAVGAYFRGATLWPSSSELVPLGYPTGWQGSLAYGIWGDQQVGKGIAPDHNSHALLWQGTAASVVDLTPTSIGWGDATDGMQQVGVSGGGATLWTGTAASHVSLAPPVYGYSEAQAVWNGIQVGWGGPEAGTNNADALLWHGSASSYTVLRPGKAFGISRGQVAGWTDVGLIQGSLQDACIWANGTPQSFMDLAPAGATASGLFGTNGIQQVGDISLEASVLGQLPLDHRPGVWRGNSATFQRLPLPAGDDGGTAYAIDGGGDIVGTVGVNNNGALAGATPTHGRRQLRWNRQLR